MRNQWMKKVDSNIVDDVVFANTGVSLSGMKTWFQRSEDLQYSVVGLKRASVLIRETYSPIYIVGDYDVDGKCAAAILYHTLERIGKEVYIRIPRRFSEGYGINESIIDEIYDKTHGDALIVTVDNGITGHEPIAKARGMGFDVLLTDHHLALDATDLPDANIVIDPNAETGADFKGYCGAGIAYKLAERLLEDSGLGVERSDKNREFLKKLLTLAAIATVADSVPLLEENFVFVRNGLAALSAGTTFAGVNSLISVFYLRGHVTEKDIAFKIAPAINADNRLNDESTMALDLLCEDDPTKAAELAAQLKGINERRKEIVEEVFNRAEMLIAKLGMEKDFPIILNLGAVLEGVIGIIAGKVAEKYGVPAIIFCETADGLMKGSARSVEGVNIHSLISTTLPLLSAFGGHAMAAGLSVTRDNYREMKARILEEAEKLERPEKKESFEYDLEISVRDVPETIRRVRRFAPYGEGNPEPVFLVKGLKTMKNGTEYVKRLSKEGVKFTDQSGVSAVGFHVSGEIGEMTAPKEMNFVGTLSENYFKNEAFPQIDMLDYEFVE